MKSYFSIQWIHENLQKKTFLFQFFVEYYLDGKLTVIPGFHSHLEGLAFIGTGNLKNQV